MTFVIMAVGFCFGLIASRLGWFNDNTPQWVNKGIINIALPAMILLKVPALVIDLSALAPIGLAWAVLLTTALTVLVLAKTFAWPAQITGAILLIAPMSNSAYFGIPFIDAVSSDQTVRYAIMYDQFGTFFALAIYAPIVIAFYSSKGSTRVTEIIKSIVLFTPFPVVLVSLFLLDENSIPIDLQLPLRWLAMTMGPAAAFVVGYSLRFELPKSLHAPLFISVGLKLVAAPILVLLLSSLFQLSEPIKQAGTLQSAMPSMITAGLIAISAGFNEKLVIAVIALSTCLSLASITLLLFVLGVL